MSEQKTEKIFVDGVNIKFPSERAPDFILLQMGFNATKFFRWCQQHMDDKGWVNITIKKSQKGTVYGELDTWTPHFESRVLPSLAEEADAKKNVSGVSLDDINVSTSDDEIPF